MSLLVCLLACPDAWALKQKPAEEEKDNPALPRQIDGQPADGMTWHLSVPKEVTTLDAVTLTSHLKNTSGRQFVFDFDGQTASPQLVITPKGGDPITIPMDRHPGFRHQSGNHKPKDGEIVQGYSVDLRVFTGKLAEGQYTIQIVYAKGDYAILDLPGFKPADLASPKATFVVRKTTMDEARASLPKNKDVRFTIDPPVVDKNDQAKVRHYRTGTVKNTGDKPITFSAYTWGHEKGQPLSMIMDWNKWNPEHGWLDNQQLGWCGTGLGPYTLKPGESVKVMLHPALEDGVYRYQFNYGVGEKPKKYEPLYSDPVHIDYFEQRFLKERKQKTS